MREAVKSSPADYIGICSLLDLASLHFFKALLLGDCESHLQICCYYLKNKHSSSTLDINNEYIYTIGI